MEYFAVVRGLISDYVLTIHQTANVASLVAALSQAQTRRRTPLTEDWVDINNGAATVRVDQISILYVEVYRVEVDTVTLENTTSPIQTFPTAY